MSRYLKNRMMNIIEESASSETFYTEGCEDNTNSQIYDGYMVADDDDGDENSYTGYSDYDEDDDEEDEDDEDFDVYDDGEVEECDESNIVLNYSVETIPVFEQDGEYYVEYSMLQKYMDCNGIDFITEAVNNLCHYNKIDRSDLSIVVEAAKRRKKKVSKSKSKKIVFAQSKLADAINKGITVKKSTKRKPKKTSKRRKRR